MKSGRGAEVTVIVPTRDRAQDLARAVESLFEQTDLPQCLLIVDQSVKTECRNLVEGAYAAASPRIREKLRLKYIHDPKISGLAEARNRAMDLLTSGIWLFLDDDVILEPRFIEEMLAAYERRPEAAGISGIVTNYATPSRLFRVWSRLFMRGPFFDDRQPVYWAANKLHGGEPVRVSRFTGAMMSFRADAVRNTRVDKQLRGVSDGEDIDFCMRLGPRAPLFIAPGARAVHNRSVVGREKRHWLARISRANYFLYQRHWRRGLKNRICFWWFTTGCALVACVAAARRRSLDPWRDLITGITDARRVTGRRNTPAANCSIQYD